MNDIKKDVSKYKLYFHFTFIPIMPLYFDLFPLMKEHVTLFGTRMSQLLNLQISLICSLTDFMLRYMSVYWMFKPLNSFSFQRLLDTTFYFKVKIIQILCYELLLRLFPQESCAKSRWVARGRARSTREAGSQRVLEELNVFNSVEVKTPVVETNARRSVSPAASYKDVAVKETTGLQHMPFCANNNFSVNV